MLHAFRYACRSLAKSLGFTVVAVMTLALGVGANTSIFSLVDSVLLRPLPYEQPEQLVLIWESAPFFGLLAYLVGQQTPEIGIRMALGATPSTILSRTIGQGLRLVLIGLGLGIVAALAVSRLLTAVLFGIKPTDPTTYGLVALVLLLTAGVACYLPARTAMQVDPIVALRED